MDKKRLFGNRLEQAIKTLANNPDSPLGLKLQSHLAKAIQPREERVQSVIRAMMQYERDPNPANQAIVEANISAWENMDGPEHRRPMPEDVRASLRDQALEQIQREQCRPPPIRDVIIADNLPRDYELELTGSLGGLEGTWHRLWSMISSDHSFQVVQGSGFGEHAVSGIKDELDAQLVCAIGRGLTETEYATLHQHAIHHAKTVLVPHLQNSAKENPAS